MRISDWSSDVCSSDLRLYLPEDWAADPIRRDKASVPHDVGFATKPAIALEQIRAAVEADLPRGVVLMDAGYGADTKLHTEHSCLGLCYVAGLQSNPRVWRQGIGPLPPATWSERGRLHSRERRTSRQRPPQPQALAHGMSQ